MPRANLPDRPAQLSPSVSPGTAMAGRAADLFPGPRPLSWHQDRVWHATAAGQLEAVLFECSAASYALQVSWRASVPRRVAQMIRRHVGAHCPLCRSTETRQSSTPTRQS